MSRLVDQDLPRWPCGTCKRKCHLNSILCGSCNYWFHGHCQGLSQVSMTQLTDISVDYVCRKCSRPNGPFDFKASLLRLSNAAKLGFNKLQSAAVLEAILVGDSPVPEPECDVDVHQRRDRITTQILTDHRLGTDHYPAATRMDGNCFYHALSQRLIGNTNVSTELRVRITIDLVNSKRVNNRTLSNSQVRLVSPDYDAACLSAATNAGYACLWTFQSAANVMNRPIRSVYPPVNGLSDICVEIMNRTFYPSGTTSSNKDPMLIMWTSIQRPLTGKTWIPDHFVPLIPFYRAPEKIVLDDSFTKTPPSRKMTYAEAAVSPKRSSPNVMQTGIDDSPSKTATQCRATSQRHEKDPVSSRTTSVDHSDYLSTRTSPISPSINDNASQVKQLQTSTTIGKLSPRVRHGPLRTSTPRTLPQLSKASTTKPKPALSNFWTDHQVDTKPHMTSPTPYDTNTTAPLESKKLHRQQGVSQLNTTASKKPGLWRPFLPDTDDTTSLENVSLSPSESPKRKHARLNDTMDSLSESLPETSASPVFKRRVRPTNIRVEPPRTATGKLKHDRFLDVDDLISHLTDADTELDAIPRGKKEDVFFVIDNQDNNERRTAGKKACFTDDCGAWSQGSTKAHFYLRQDGKLTYLEKKDGQFYTLRSKNARTPTSATKRDKFDQVKEVLHQAKASEGL